MQFVELDREACKFRYRKSLFNRDEPDRYIVTRVDFQLHPDGQPRVTYGDIQRYFAESTRSCLICKLLPLPLGRFDAEKGMLIVEGDSDCRSAGSFFKNPVVATAGRVAEIAAAGVTEGGGAALAGGRW